VVGAAAHAEVAAFDVAVEIQRKAAELAVTIEAKFEFGLNPDWALGRIGRPRGG